MRRHSPMEPAENPTQDTAADVLHAEDAEAISATARRERSVAQSIMERLEQGLREAVHGDVQKTAGTTAPSVQTYVQRVHGPPRESIDEEALTRGQGASLRGARWRGIELVDVLDCRDWPSPFRRERGTSVPDWRHEGPAGSPELARRIPSTAG